MTRLRDLTIALPPRWRRRSDPDHGVLVHARAATLPHSGVAPELVLRCAPVDDDLPQWRADAMSELAGQLVGFEVDDEDAFELEGRPVVYARFAHRLGSTDLVSEQWSWLLGGTGITLTGTVAREDYADYCEVFDAVAATFEPGSRAA
ncbi:MULTISPECIES: hypothetical protein [unclassified Nocardioides]|uniref:hypothetical protein n=1 Tax=unclassified Nocardioides TaxID=2615069 RepID=UPI0030147BAF